MSGSGVLSTVQAMPQVSMIVPISSVMTMPLSPPQGPLPSIGEIQADNQFPLGPQGIDVFLLVQYLMRLLDKMDITVMMMDIWTRMELHKPVQQGVSIFNLGIKPKDPLVFHGQVMEDVTTRVAKVSDFFFSTKATD